MIDERYLFIESFWVEKFEVIGFSVPFFCVEMRTPNCSPAVFHWRR